VAEAENCNWGVISANVIMTSLTRDEELRNKYKTLLMMLSLDFGEEGSATDIFRIFESGSYGGKQNLLFSDEAVMFKDISTVAGGTRDTYYTWAGLILTNSHAYSCTPKPTTLGRLSLLPSVGR